jgi:signal peptidase I
MALEQSRLGDKLASMNLRRLRIVLLLLPALFVLAACGGSGKSSTTNGSVPAETATTPTRMVTYAEPSSTMEPTIQCGRGAMKGCTGVANDHVAVEEPAPPIARLDIILFHRPREAPPECGAGRPFIQRVIGLPDDVVREDDHGFIWIKIPGGAKFVKLNEPYVSASTRLADSAHFGQTWRVPFGHYFTLGDNRALQVPNGVGTCDSRAWVVSLPPPRAIIGKVVRIIRPSSG